MAGALMTAVLLAVPVQFPMESSGVLEAYSFFHQSIEHFIYGNIEAHIRILQAGNFSWKLGLAMETYMGESWNSPEMKFNIYGGHWNIKVQFQYLLDPYILRIYTDHECFHNIDMADTVSEYMNNIKLGVLLDQPPPPRGRGLTLLPSGLPDGYFSIGFYRPRSETFQKGHDFNWSMHGFLDFEGVSWESWIGGLRYKADFYIDNDGTGLSRHSAEIYAAYQAPSGGVFELQMTHYLRDTQPFRPLEGETYWGIRFKW